MQICLSTDAVRASSNVDRTIYVSEHNVPATRRRVIVSTLTWHRCHLYMPAVHPSIVCRRVQVHFVILGVSGSCAAFSVMLPMHLLHVRLPAEY